MSTVERPEARTLPTLVEGQALDQPTFHERYAAMPPEIRAELVGGIVHMASPLLDPHGLHDIELGGWVVQYVRATPGTRGVSNVTTKLGPSTEVQPDCQLRIREECGGRARLEWGYVVGPPELVIEIGASSRSFDLGPKKADYEAAGVLEFLFVGVDPQEIRWFRSVDGRFEVLGPGPDGIYRSNIFPGLWLDPAALFAEDLERLFTVLEQGMATDEHRDFVEELRARKDRPRPG